MKHECDKSRGSAIRQIENQWPIVPVDNPLFNHVVIPWLGGCNPKTPRLSHQNQTSVFKVYHLDTAELIISPYQTCIPYSGDLWGSDGMGWGRDGGCNEGVTSASPESS